jgi:hypothetical protein
LKALTHFIVDPVRRHGWSRDALGPDAGVFDILTGTHATLHSKHDERSNQS